jgi:RNA polymerase sigma-70 factor (ECF subfamily)
MQCREPSIRYSPLGDGEGSVNVDPADAEELLARLRAGDERAFEGLVEAWSGGMTRVARSFVSTQDSAVEVVQDTWLAVIAGLDRFEGRSSLKTWTYRILINTAKRRGLVEHRTIPMSSLGDEDSGPTVDPARFRQPGEPYAHHWQEFPEAWPPPDQLLLDGELRARIVDAVEQLPERQRLVITLRDIEGYGASEVCELLDLTESNQRVLLHRARAAVRGRIEDYVTARTSRDDDLGEREVSP